MFSSHDHHEITECCLPTLTLWKNQSFHFRFHKFSPSRSARRGRVLSMIDSSLDHGSEAVFWSMGQRRVGRTLRGDAGQANMAPQVTCCWLNIWWRTAADWGGGVPLCRRRWRAPSGDLSGTVDADFGPWASCEQRAT